MKNEMMICPKVVGCPYYQIPCHHRLHHKEGITCNGLMPECPACVPVKESKPSPQQKAAETRRYNRLQGLQSDSDSGSY